MKLRFILCCLLLPYYAAMAQTDTRTPMEKSGGTKVTENGDMVAYLIMLQKQYPVFQVDTTNRTIEGRVIPVVSFGTPVKADRKKLQVLFFAQQHGDEPSGKEGMLMLIRDLATGKKKDLLEKLQITIIPQVNPDGGAVCRRRNGNKMDLNRNHLILTEKETSLIHEIYHATYPDLTIDFHEYSPYSESWTAYGALKNYDEQMGTLTNPNIPPAMIAYQKTKVLPAVEKVLKAAGFSYHEYLVGGAPETERLRYSTTHINDGRQGLGFFGSLSFIIEGKNGKDCSDNIGRRALGQFTAASAVLAYAKAHDRAIKKLVQQTRAELAAEQYGKTIGTIYEHVGNGETLPLTLLSVATGKDTSVQVKLFHPVVKCLHEVTMPLGYLIPRNDLKLIATLKKHHIPLLDFIPEPTMQVMAYLTSAIDTLTIEEDEYTKPQFRYEPANINAGNYLYLPMNGVHQRYAVLALEPVSFYGLHQFEVFKYLLQSASTYPVLRVEKKK